MKLYENVTPSIIDALLIAILILTAGFCAIKFKFREVVIPRAFKVWDGKTKVCKPMKGENCRPGEDCLVSVCWPAHSAIEYHDPRDVINVDPARRWLYRKPRRR